MDYKIIIREEMNYQRRRLYKRLRTGDGKLIVEYWQGSKNFLNAIHGIVWEKQGNKILIKEKATEMKSFRDILLLEKSARTGTTTQKDRTGHIHSVILDDDGTGKTVGTKGGDDHVHKVVEYSVQPSGGHTHKLADKLNETDPRIKMKLTKLEPGDLFKKLKQAKAWSLDDDNNIGQAVVTFFGGKIGISADASPGMNIVARFVDGKEVPV